jgi:hypothetical protein
VTGATPVQEAEAARRDADIGEPAAPASNVRQPAAPAPEPERKGGRR